MLSTSLFDPAACFIVMHGTDFQDDNSNIACSQSLVLAWGGVSQLTNYQVHSDLLADRVARKFGADNKNETLYWLAADSERRVVE